MPPATDTTDIDATKGSWGAKGGCVIKTNVYKNQYAVRADGEFSDQTKVSSGYVLQQVDGNQVPGANLTLMWSGGFPKSTVPKKISCAGTYTGNANAQNTGLLTAIPVTGGKKYETVLKTNAVAKTWLGDPDITVDASVMHSVIGWAGDNGQNQLFYCTPYAVVQVAP